MSHRFDAALAPLARATATALPRLAERRLANPVFVVGCGRSGTTLLMRLLAAHPALAVYPTEANELWHPEAYPWVRSRLDLPPFWRDPREFTRISLQHRGGVPPSRLRAVFGAYQLLRRGSHFVNKSAMTAFMLPFIDATFPGARFLHLYRNGYAVALSYAKLQQARTERDPAYAARPGGLSSFDELLETCAGVWNEHVMEIEARKASPELGGRILDVRYEELCARPAEDLARIAGFLGIDAHPFRRGDYRHIEATNFKLRRELEPEQLRSMTPPMLPGLERLGYPREDRAASRAAGG